jgi:hypothetical protein
LVILSCIVSKDREATENHIWLSFLPQRLR